MRILKYKMDFNDPVILDIVGKKTLVYRLFGEKELRVREQEAFRPNDRGSAVALQSWQLKDCAARLADGTTSGQGVMTHVLMRHETQKAAMQSSFLQICAADRADDPGAKLPNASLGREDVPRSPSTGAAPRRRQYLDQGRIDLRRKQSFDGTQRGYSRFRSRLSVHLGSKPYQVIISIKESGLILSECQQLMPKASQISSPLLGRSSTKLRPTWSATR